MQRHSPIFEGGTIVRVPFPYTDRDTRQRRPALVVSRAGAGEDQNLVWVVMITSAANRRWPDDILIADHADRGLPVASLIRPAKIATIDAAAADRIGTLDAERMAKVRQAIVGIIRGVEE